MRKSALLTLAATAVLCSSANAAHLMTHKIDMNRSSGSCQNFTQILGPAEICAVTGSGGHFQGGGEFGIVTFENNTWVFRGNSCQPGVFFHISCYTNISH